MDKETLNTLIANAKKSISAVREYAEKNNLLDSQEYINFENFLNFVSNMDPNMVIENYKE